MPFKDELFPTGVSYGATGGPGGFGVEIAGNGNKEWRNLTSSLPRYEFEVSHAARLPEHWRPLQAFFLNMCAQFYSFRFLDHLDYVVSTGEGAFDEIDASHFQMVKLYQFGSQTFRRRITKPINGTINLTGGGTVDYSTGIVTGTPSAWTGQFHVHARFNTDRMERETITRYQGDYIVGWASIPVVEIKAAE